MGGGGGGVMMLRLVKVTRIIYSETDNYVFA